MAGWVDTEEALAAVVLQSADERVCRLVEGGQAKASRMLPEAIRRLSAVSVRLPAAEEVAWRSLLNKVVPARDPTALLQEIARSPQEDGPRAVLADLLQEQGDPQGEFITLQLREAEGLGSQESVARAQQLLKEHGRKWLGPLAQIVERAEFRRGLPYGLDLSGSWAADEKHWAKLSADPRLGTVVRVARGGARADVYARFVSGPGLTALENLEVFDDVLLPVLEARRESVREVACVGKWGRASMAERFRAGVLPLLETCCRLTTVKIDDDSLRDLQEAACFPRLRRLWLNTVLEKGFAVVARLPPSLELVLEDCCTTLELPQGKVARVSVKLFSAQWMDSVVKCLRKLPRRFERLEVTAGKPVLKALQDGLAKREVLVVAAAPRSGLLTGIRR